MYHKTFCWKKKKKKKKTTKIYGLNNVWHFRAHDYGFWSDSSSTSILAWAFAGRLCDKYHNLMSWLIFLIIRFNSIINYSIMVHDLTTTCAYILWRNTTYNNRSHFIQTGSHTIFHWFICSLNVIHTQMYRPLKFSAWTLLLRTKYLQPA